MLIVYNDCIIGADDDSVSKFFRVDMSDLKCTIAMPANREVKTDELVKHMFLFSVTT